MIQNIEIDKSISNIGPLDFSWLLDAPAGKHGFVQIRNGRLFFEDGTRAKFIGFNFPCRANMPDHETADRISAKLATLGVNVVRLVANDVSLGTRTRGWSANPDSPLIDYASGTSRTFHEKGWDYFDYWVSKLEERGIYLHIDLLTARAFRDDDELDYPDSPPAPIKSINHLNQRLIELQMEYATKYLTHVNPYTGKSLIDDPAVMTIEIANEDSIFFDAENLRHWEGIVHYRREMQKRFNHYLISKYHTRKNLAQAWTFENQCALRENEDPEQGTVRCPQIGDYYQPNNEPMGDWMAEDSPPRYADFVEFGIMINRKYYGTMIDHIHSLGAKVPLSTSNLLTGAADVFSHSDGDVMENNSYFNHPAPGHDHKNIHVPRMREYVSTDPRTETFPGLDIKSNLTTQAMAAAVDGKPFVMSEWNEYGENPFHSTAFMMTAAYACLNDWDGLMIYCYHTADRYDDQPADEITDIMDAYNDPSLICQFGVMAALFLRDMVKSAQNRFDVVYTMNDLYTQPLANRLPMSILPLISKVRNVFLTQGDVYNGKADMAVSAGFVSSGNYDNAAHGIIYAHSPYRDAFRRFYSADAHLQHYKDGSTQDLMGIAGLNGRYLVFDDIASLTREGDYTAFAQAADIAMKQWGLVGPDRGIVDEDNIISDTGELVFNPAQSFFQIKTEGFVLFSGKPQQSMQLGRRYTADSRNDRITLSLFPLDGRSVSESEHLLFTAMGKSGLDKTTFEELSNGETRITLEGKLYVDALEGTLEIGNCSQAELWALDTYGSRAEQISGEISNNGCARFLLDGHCRTANYELIVR